MNNKIAITTIFSLIVCGSIESQTIAEKKANASRPMGGDLTEDTQKLLIQVNKEMGDSQQELRVLYSQVEELFAQNAPPEEYKQLLERIHQARQNIRREENAWRETVTKHGQETGYALWHQPETTLGQLILDYGSQRYVYMMSPEISGIKLSVDSNLPIPSTSWDEMLELILTQNGVGIKQLNPFLRQLFLVKQDKSALKMVTNKRPDLNYLPPSARVAFMLSPEPAEVRRVWLFMEKFVNPNSTVLQAIGRDILLVGQVSDVQELLKLYDFVSTNRGDKEYRAISLTRVDAEEMAKVLGAIFEQAPIIANSTAEKGPPERQPRQGQPTLPFKKESSSQDSSEANGLRVIALKEVANAVFLVGTREEIKKAEEIIRQVESQVGEARERTLWLYTAKNSDAEELAQVLNKIYYLMVTTGTGTNDQNDSLNEGLPPPPPPQFNPNPPTQLPIRGIYEEGYLLTDQFIVGGEEPNINDNRPLPNLNRDNFIVDQKTGTIVMVVEADILPKMKELLKKLDVPKKMVQIEVMLFEKRLERNDNMGLNLLQIGDAVASNINQTSLLFNNDPVLAPGLFQFIIKRKQRSGIPAYDQAYQFLITQNDIQINASPSILTVNQVPASIKIEDEISVNTGIYIIENAGANTLKDSYQRARYGIKIEVTPTIHMNAESGFLDDTTNYITLDTNLVFETFRNTFNDRPDVTRRFVNNQVRIPDGQTVIIGGLRRKDYDDSSQAIPFLGEIPGFGKFFSNNFQSDIATEMFLFITPKIVVDPVADLEKLRCEEMARRPGDVPEFLCALLEAREIERNQFLQGTITTLFGRPPERCTYMEGPLHVEGEYCGYE